MKTVKLFGDLQRFKDEWELDVKYPGEALRAIEANRPGFLSAADSGDYIAILFDEHNPEMTRQVTMDNVSAPWADEILLVVPRAGGDIPVAAVVIAMETIGVALAADGFAALALTALVNIAVSMAVSALANVIVGPGKSVNQGDTERYDSKPSFVSNGPINLTRAGNPYPIIAGQFLCGSIVLSSQIHVKDIPV